MKNTLLKSLSEKLKLWHQSSSSEFDVYGATIDQWQYFYTSLLEQENQLFNQRYKVIICPNQDKAEEFYAILKKYYENKNVKILLYPGLDCSPYESVLTSEKNLLQRFKSLQLILDKKESLIVIGTLEAFSLKTPTRQFFTDNKIVLRQDDILSPRELSQKLVDLGYSKTPTVEEPGCFSQRGEIFDIFPISFGPVRLHYFDDLIEKIHHIDPLSQKTTFQLNSNDILEIGPAPGCFTQASYRNILRENIPIPNPQFKFRFEKRKELFNQLSDGRLFENHPLFTACFFDSSNTIFNILPEKETFLIYLEEREGNKDFCSFMDKIQEEYQAYNKTDSHIIAPSPAQIWDENLKNTIYNYKILKTNSLEIEIDFENQLQNKISLNLESSLHFLKKNINPTLSRPEFIKFAIEKIKKHLHSNGEIVYCSNNKAAQDEFKHLLLSEDNSDSYLLNHLSFKHLNLTEGFYYEPANLLVMSDSDLFSKKIAKTKKSTSKKIDLFAEQLATLKVGDYVIHSSHGLGVYNGLESIKINETTSDYLIIQYAEGDKVYVPVYKMNLIQKHADSNLSLKPANLRLNKFIEVKRKARESAKALAFDLLKLQAERQTSHSFMFSPPDDNFREFELAFPYEETPDQSNAINEVISAMQRPTPMDFLICGDVGFGKTEIAMRAAFKAVLDKKQVVVLVPTTILALQHFNSFQKRFKDFPVQIDFLSRFKSPQEVKSVITKIKEGKIDIVIGTHKVLSDQIEFKDLGLIIVDEEQRFGVAHKEKFKLLKSNIDFLTLTATPIPRTLQLAFLGIRDLALIQTAPPKRQSIKTYIIKEDPLTLKTAIMKEISRGGQVFIVHNRVQDMEEYYASIKDLVPEAKIVFAHGQMGERELEKRIKDFYEKKYQILLATTIIESGIDIPNANTMIIDRADTFGLSQLHQLRGRIGRSDRKAYAYFIVPDKTIGSDAEKRLKALQTYADVGSGFSLATSDLEIRGAGDILGGEQSGHIEGVGLELYMELLKEAIQELKGEKQSLNKNLEVTTPFAAMLPSHYINDASERLKMYKKLSNCETIQDLISFEDEVVDIYGPANESVKNLFKVLEIRIFLMKAGVKSISISERNIILTFDQAILNENIALRNKVVETFISRPKTYQFTPDYKVIYQHKSPLKIDDCVEFAKDIAQKIIPC